MSDEQVERVARAIYEAVSGRWTNASDGEREQCRVEARAAIAALQAPQPGDVERARELLLDILGRPPKEKADRLASAFALVRADQAEKDAAVCDLAEGSYGPAEGWTEEHANWWDIGVADGSAMCRDRIRAGAGNE